MEITSHEVGDSELTIGRFLSSKRWERRLTQAQLAELVGAKAAMISMVEGDRRRPGSALAARIAEELRLTDGETKWLNAALSGKEDPSSASRPNVTVIPSGSRVRRRATANDATLVGAEARKFVERSAALSEVLACHCARHHPNKPGSTRCRVPRCGSDVDPTVIVRVPRPSLGRLVFRDRLHKPIRTERFTRDIAIGRDEFVLRTEARLSDPFVFADPYLSSHHLDVVAEGWDLYVLDHESTNGSALLGADDDSTPVPLVPGRYYRLEAGYVVQLTRNLEFILEVEDPGS